MGGVSGDQFQALIDSDGGYHRVRPANGLADAVEIAGNGLPVAGGQKSSLSRGST
jgi:hypothetical protein